VSPDQARDAHAAANNDFCYLPGNSVDDYRPWQAGKAVPAGSDIILSLHYTTNGKAVVDRTKIGLTVAKTPPLKKVCDATERRGYAGYSA